MRCPSPLEAFNDRPPPLSVHVRASEWWRRMRSYRWTPCSARGTAVGMHACAGAWWAQVLKMDVEGYEPYVLLGAGRLLARRRVWYMVIEFNPFLLRSAKGDLPTFNVSLSPPPPPTVHKVLAQPFICIHAWSCGHAGSPRSATESGLVLCTEAPVSLLSAHQPIAHSVTSLHAESAACLLACCSCGWGCDCGWAAALRPLAMRTHSSGCRCRRRPAKHSLTLPPALMLLPSPTSPSSLTPLNPPACLQLVLHVSRDLGYAISLHSLRGPWLSPEDVGLLAARSEGEPVNLFCAHAALFA